MITGRMRCTHKESNTERREDRYVGAGLHIRLLNIDEIDTLNDKLSETFSIALERYNHPDQPSSMVLVDIREVILNIVYYVAPAANGYIQLSTKLNNTHSIINPKNENDNYCFY